MDRDVEGVCAMRELIDLDTDINTAFPGTILGVSKKGDTYWVNQWHKGVTENQKAMVNDFIANYNWNAESESEIKAREETRFREDVAIVAASLKGR